MLFFFFNFCGCAVAASHLQALGTGVFGVWLLGILGIWGCTMALCPVLGKLLHQRVVLASASPRRQEILNNVVSCKGGHNGVRGAGTPKLLTLGAPEHAACSMHASSLLMHCNLECVG